MKNSGLSFQPIEKMLWIPGQGPDMALLDELATAFPKPIIPTGRTLRMEHRVMLDNLNANGMEEISQDTLWWYVYEIVEHIVFYPPPENYWPDWLGWFWTDWYAYLMPRIVARSQFNQAGWATQLINGVFALSLFQPQNEITRHQNRFAEILGQYLMRPSVWKKRGQLGLWTDNWGNFILNSEVSMSLFLVWRYLSTNALRSWFESVLAIKDISWRAQLIIWMVEIWPLFEAGKATYPVIKKPIFANKINMWGEDSVLSIPLANNSETQQISLIAPENIAALHIAIRELFTQRRYFLWIEQIAAQPDLWPQMEMWMNRFQNKYLV